jgi:hypothetical protein
MTVKTEEILPYPAFFSMMENNFSNKQAFGRLTPEELESEKGAFLASADCKLLLYAIRIKKTTNVEPVVISEESIYSNDNKVYKKIPHNCKVVGIKCCTLPDCFKEHLGINPADLMVSYTDSILNCRRGNPCGCPEPIPTATSWATAKVAPTTRQI